MSSSDFQQIAIRAESGRAERLFRAAVSAFCSLPRPSRREIAQLEDLTLPLFEHVPADSLRFVAAALSECEYAPARLVRRLAEESLDIAAPLLMRSRALSDIDLLALIGRHGLPHARAIAGRKELNPTIAHLIRALERPTLVRVRTAESEMETAESKSGEVVSMLGRVTAEDPKHPLTGLLRKPPLPLPGGEESPAEAPSALSLPPRSGEVARRSRDGEGVCEDLTATGEPVRETADGFATTTATSARSGGAEGARRRLRTMMRPARPETEASVSINPFTGPDAYAKLRETALTGNAAFFHTALADALDIDFSIARSITESQSYASLLTAFRALDLSEDKAFLIAVAIFPKHFPHPEAIRLFLDRFRLLHRDVALDRLRGWKAEGVSRAILEAGHKPAIGAANADAPVNDRGRRFGRKAS